KPGQVASAAPCTNQASGPVKSPTARLHRRITGKIRGRVEKKRLSVCSSLRICRLGSRAPPPKQHEPTNATPNPGNGQDGLWPLSGSIRGIGIIDDKPPGTICLPTDHFRAQASSHFSRFVCCTRLENPITVQHGQI